MKKPNDSRGSSIAGSLLMKSEQEKILMPSFELKHDTAPESVKKLQDNETVRLIMERRSIRSFEPRPVEPKKIEILLECAFAAPSAMNHRPCHLMRIDSRELLDRIGAASERTRMVQGAPLVIAVCVDVARYEKVHQLTDGTWMADSACAMENILIAARALGLEGVWLQIANRPEREEAVLPLLNIPEGVKVFAMAVVGYGAEVKAPHSGLETDRLHHNGWGQP